MIKSWSINKEKSIKEVYNRGIKFFILFTVLDYLILFIRTDFTKMDFFILLGFFFLFFFWALMSYNTSEIFLKDDSIQINKINCFQGKRQLNISIRNIISLTYKNEKISKNAQRRKTLKIVSQNSIFKIQDGEFGWDDNVLQNIYDLVSLTITQV